VVRSYNRYLAVAARVVRRSLKEGPRLQAERRGEMDLRFAKWEVGISCTQGPLRKTNTFLIQNGKQGENKNLASENANAMAQSAGQESK
jgi:F-type H+-transporting ATPase subunit epsilon